MLSTLSGYFALSILTTSAVMLVNHAVVGQGMPAVPVAGLEAPAISGDSLPLMPAVTGEANLSELADAQMTRELEAALGHWLTAPTAVVRSAPASALLASPVSADKDADQWLAEQRQRFSFDRLSADHRSPDQPSSHAPGGDVAVPPVVHPSASGELWRISL